MKPACEGKGTADHSNCGGAKRERPRSALFVAGISSVIDVAPMHVEQQADGRHHLIDVRICPT